MQLRLLARPEVAPLNLATFSIHFLGDQQVTTVNKFVENVAEQFASDRLNGERVPFVVDLIPAKPDVEPKTYQVRQSCIVP